MDVLRVTSCRVRWTAVLVVVALFVLAVPAEARPLGGAGTGMITGLDVDVIREAGGNVTQVRQVEGVVEGAVEGTFVQTVTGVVHKSGLVTFHGTMTFTGTVEGCGEGTFTVGVTGRAQSGLPTADATFRVINQAANTLAVRGTGTLRQVGPAFTYEVAYTC
jgi:hypothetical protein